MTSTNHNPTFLQLLVLSRLVSEGAVQELRERFSDQVATDAGLASVLVKHGLLTAWQAQKLLKGKHQGFFLGDYKLLSHLAKGGMSTLYSAKHTINGELRALKVLPPSKASRHSYLPRFLREARLTAALRHVNIMRVYEVVRHDPNKCAVNFMAMELLQGRDLYRMVSTDGPPAFSVAAEIIRQAARGLHHVHRQGLVHRDVKPGNLFFTDQGIVKIIDLGLASITDDFDENLTREYNERVLGTADYLAPEQAVDSHKADRRADVYGLGCTFYFLLTGQPPFAEGGLAQRILAHQARMPQDVRTLRQDVPSALRQLLLEMLVKDPGQRIQNMDLVAQRLEGWLSQSSDKTAALLCSDKTAKPDELLESRRKLKRIVPRARRLAAETPTDFIRSTETQAADSISGFVKSSAQELVKRPDAR